MLWLKINLIFLLLIGCGFKPIYDIGNKYNLPGIYIENIEEQSGYLLKNKLEDKFFASNNNLSKKYSLKINLSKTSNPLTIQKSNIVTYYNVIISASYELKSLENNQIIYRNNFQNISSYSATNAEFANYISEEDATNNNIEQLSESILTDLNIFFSNITKAQS